MKVRIDRRDHEGWRYFSAEDGKMQSPPHKTYYDAKHAALAAGHEIQAGGWLHRLLMWNFNNHAIDGYPGWEKETDRSPAFAKLQHERGNSESDVESHKLAAAWDDVAKVDFYQRDWTDDGLPFVREKEVYWSGWWFATIVERDRFLAWARERGAVEAPR